MRSTNLEPNHYETLGLQIGENDPQVIRAANLSRTREEKSRVLGAHSEEALATLNNIGKAYSVLRDPVLKARYDNSLGVNGTKEESHSRDSQTARKRMPPPPPRHVDLVESRAEVFRDSQNESVLPTTARETHRDLPRFLPGDDGKGIRWAIGSISAVSLTATAVALWVPWLALFSVPMCLVFGVWWGVLCWQTPLNQIRWKYWMEIRQDRKDLQQKYMQLQAIQAPNNDSSPARRELHNVMAKSRAEYARIAVLKQSELRTYNEKHRQTQLESYLRGHTITPNSIKGVGESRLATLHSYGITTALDISTDVAGVPGFGPSLTEATLAWRDDLLNRFKPKSPTNTAGWLEISSKHDARAKAIESTLASEPELLREILANEEAEAIQVRSEIGAITAKISNTTDKLDALANYSWF